MTLLLLLVLCLVLCLRFEFAVNLAVALANQCQLKVGLLDADVYGPNIPTMMKINKKPEVTEGDFFYSILLPKLFQCPDIKCLTGIEK